MPFYDIRGLVLSHVVSNKVIEVNKEKMEVIENLPPPTSVKGVRSFHGHVSFCRQFMKEFSIVANFLTQLPIKDVSFEFNKECLSAFLRLKEH